MSVSHHILKLVTEPISAAGLVERGPSPEAAGQRLVQQPAVQQDIHTRIGGLHLSLFQNFIPKLADTLPCRFYMLDVLKMLDESFCICAVCTLPEQEGDLFGFTGLQPEQEL